MSKLGTIILKRKNKTVYVNKETNSVIKKFNAKLESKSNVLAEALNQAKVEETGLSIPSIKEVFKDGDDWCISSTYIEGKTLQELMDENKDKEDEYIEKLVDIQIDIQKVKCPSLNLLTNKLHERISSTRDYIEATTRYELHMRLNSMPKHTKLCHCDMNPTNIIIDKDGNYHIVDWAHACQGNASADVAMTYLYFMLNHKESIAKKYLNLFCQKTDTAIQYIQKWMPIAAALMSLKAEGEDKKYLVSLTDVCEYE